MIYVDWSVDWQGESVCVRERESERAREREKHYMLTFVIAAMLKKKKKDHIYKL